MNVTCPNCASVYRVDPAKVPEAGVRARCAVCSAIFAVRREVEQSRTAVKEPARAEPKRPEPPRAPARTEAPRAEPPKAEPARVEPSRPEPSRPAAPIATASPSRPAPPPPAATPPRPAAPPRPASPGGLPPSPAMPPASAPAAAARPAAPVGAPPASAPARPSTPPASAPSPGPRPAPGGRPANPFLSQDPSLKARRLARALISDMVVYHPGRRQEGLRDGNLKELFEEEIKKSWEEYAEQVGRDVAESTPYFREALNEILASGRQIF
jgi:predicted Zn finger-like uncharacterized protein